MAVSILDQIVTDTWALVRERKVKVRRSRLEDQPGYAAERHDFAAALRADGLSVIAEIKKASPSKGLIREDFDPTGIAQQYEDGEASAISVLTEPFHFQGSLDDLAAVRKAVGLPLLRKDFIVDPYQVTEARAYGADAILLIAAVLDPGQLAELHAAADELGLAALVEIYDVRELDRLDFGQVRILGVNNRDLRTFEVDIDHSLRVFAEVPEGLIRVSESGLRSAKECAYLRERGVDAVLIGETFMRAPSPGDALKSLRERVYDMQ